MTATIEKALAYEITHIYDGIQISEQELRRLIDIASWNEKVPHFEAPGRVAWENLEEPVSLKADPERQFLVAKLKGVGVYNPPLEKKYSGVILEQYDEKPSHPTTLTWKDLVTYPHFGIADDGNYKFAYSHPAPIGGILHERALAEYSVAKKMLEAGISSVVPLAVIKYDDFYFRGKQMGAVITLSVSKSHLRASEALWGTAVNRGKNPQADAYYDDMRATLGVEGDPADETTRLETMRLIAGRIGKLMRQFSLAGFYRYSGEWSNYQFSAETNELLFIDLDSSRVMADDKLPDFRQSLEAIRDLATAIYRSTAKLAYPTVVDKYTLSNLLKYNPIFELLRNYFPEAAEEDLQQVSRKLYNFFIPYWFLLKKYRDPIYNVEWDRERRKTYKMDHDLFYILVITSLFPIFEASALGKKYPACPDQATLLQRAKDHLGDRYEYFLYLLNDGELG